MTDDGDEWADGDVVAEWRAGAATAESAGADSKPARRPDLDHVAAVRTVRLVAVAGAFAVLGFVALLLAGALDGADEEGAEDPVVLSEGAAVIGPAPGAALAEYVAGRQAALAQATADHAAVVSLASYRGAAAVAELLDDAGVEVVATFVALPGGRPTLVTDPVAAWVEAQRAPLLAERDEIAGLLPTIEDPEDPFIAGYTEDLARLDAQLAALDPAADLVFATVVRGSAERLRALATRPEVRLVDVGIGVDDLDDQPLTALRPEELEVAGQPPTRPL